MLFDIKIYKSYFILLKMENEKVNNWKDFGEYFLKTSAALLSLPYAIPTVIRKVVKEKQHKSIGRDYGIGVGFWAGFFGSTYGQFQLYSYLEMRLLTIMGIVLTTNIISSGYEIYKNSKNKLIKKGKSLESEVKI